MMSSTETEATVPQTDAGDEVTDATATAIDAELAAQTVGGYSRAWLARVRAGDAGALPVIAGLIIITILFQSLNSNVLTAANLVDLLIQGSIYMLLALAELFALLLGEIDLSIGFVAGLGGVIVAELLSPSSSWPVAAAVIVAALAVAAMGASTAR